MAAFIVISADNRLHYLVDGIEKCRPLNPAVCTNISTGKIIKGDSGYTYEYKIQGEDTKNKEKNSLCDLLSNQLAAFRLANTIPEESIVNIFLLENPLCNEDYDEVETWLNEFAKVYDNGQGSDTGFRLFRIIFTYNLEKPTNVIEQTPLAVLKDILDRHCFAVKDANSFSQYVFYIDNQKSDAAAMCLDKQEHDLKMPRFLIDFMMLISNDADSYGVLSAINSVTSNTRCFSVGFAESMYYYLDVERYYSHADERDLYLYMLTTSDEKDADVSQKAMDIDKYPFGLRLRLGRLKEIYADVPFKENIELYPKSSDKTIDDCISSLKILLEIERNKEFENFNNSEPVVNLRAEISECQHLIQNVKMEINEDIDTFEKRQSDIKDKKEKLERDLNELINNFVPDCPEYIDRMEIYQDLCVADEESLESDMESLSKQYRQLRNFIASRKFLDFVKKYQEEEKVQNDEHELPQLPNHAEFENRPGCLGRLLFWINKKPTKVPPSVNCMKAMSESIDNPIKKITTIKEQLDLKNAFIHFQKQIDDIENKYKKQKEYCEQFELTTHTNHYFPLINLGNLRLSQEESFDDRRDNIISQWRTGPHYVLANLLELLQSDSKRYTKEKYAFVNWDNPFPFVEELNPQNNFPKICNELQKRAAPFVNYNLTPEFRENKVVRVLYSDRPFFEEEFTLMRDKLDNGNAISAKVSTHIASKVSMMQFLPMDEEILKHLVDLQDDDETDMTKIESIEEQLKGDFLQINDEKEPTIVDWGEY